MAAWRRVGALLGSALVLVSCAQITSTSEVTLVPGKGEAEVIGTSGGWELDRAYAIRWLQLGNQLVVQLDEHRSCQEILHAPVVRIERITRKADATLVWEFLVSAALAGFATYAFAQPEAFGGRYTDENGDLVVNKTAGYRTGGIFIGIAGILFASGVYDLFRARDESVYTDAYELRPGAAVECEDPVRAVVQRSVTLVVGEHEDEAVTDRQGRARLFLPAETEFANKQGEIEPRTINAAIKVDKHRAVRVDFVVPYDRRGMEAHVGQSEPEPSEMETTAPTREGPSALPPGTPPADARQRELERNREATRKGAK